MATAIKKKAIKKPTKRKEESNVLNLKNVKFLLKTTYAGRRSVTPILTVTKAGFTTLNAAFCHKYGYLRPRPSKNISIQVVPYKTGYVLLISKIKRNFFYLLSLNTNKNAYHSKIAAMQTLFGKKGLAMRYELTPISLNDSSLQGFTIKYVAADLFATRETNDFEIAQK